MPDRRARVLIVDGASTVRDVLGMTLEGTGSFDVVAVASASEALSRLEAGDYDVMIADLEGAMLDAIVSLRATPRGERLRIVGLGPDGEDAELRAKEAGVDALVIKPIQVERVREAVAEVLGDAIPAMPTASGYMLLGVQTVLDSLPYPAMLLDADHNVLIGNHAFFSATRATVGDCGLVCAEVMHHTGMPVDCPLVEAARTDRTVERVINETVAGPVHVSVYPTEIVNGEGKRLYLHVTRPMSTGGETRH